MQGWWAEISPPPIRPPGAATPRRRSRNGTRNDPGPAPFCPRERGRGSRRWPASGAAGQFGLHRDGEVALVLPAAGVGGAVPALQRNRPDVLALLVVEHLEVRLPEVGADLRGRAAEVDEAFAAVVEDRDRPPSLGLGFGLVEHVVTLLGPEFSG